MTRINLMIKKIINNSDIHLQELLKESFYSFLIKISGMALGYISLLIITNIYGAHAFGTLTLAITLMSIFLVIPKFGLDTSLVRIIGELYTLKKMSEIIGVIKISFLFVAFLTAIFSIILYYSAPIIANSLLEKPNMAIYFQIIAFAMIPNVLLIIISAVLRGMKLSSLYMFIHTALNQSIFLLFLLLNHLFNVTENLVLIYVISFVFSLCFGTFVFSGKIKNLNIKKMTIYEYDLFKIIKISSPMLLATSFALIMQWTDIIMLGIFESETEVGIYSSAQRIAGLTSLTLVAINAIAAPKFIEFYAKKDFKGLEKIAKQSTKIIFLTSAPLLLIFIFFSDLIMSFLGNEFIIGATVLIILSFGQFINSISGSVGYIMQMTDNQKIFQNVIIVASGLNILLNYFLIPKYGINGAAFASMITVVFLNITLVFLIKQKLGFLTIYLPGITRKYR